MQPELLQLTLASGLEADVLRKGSGEPIVFFHGRLGRVWDGYLDTLAETHCVYAPLHPGSQDADELLQLDAISDLVLYYDDVIRALEIERPALVGHCFGGMVAAEYAAYFPDRVRKLVLLGALGLWRDDVPVADLDSLNPDRVPGTLVRDPSSAAVAALFSMPDDPAALGEAMVARVSMTAAVNHFIWPIPDRDLRRRLYRVTAPALLVWGRDDAYVPLVYATEFSEQLRNAEICVVDNAGHFPQVEQVGVTSAQTLEFLGP
jgi:pimeloyl-ACP methyl ester carboxylesterase